jgi:hypothetical protein
VLGVHTDDIDLAWWSGAVLEIVRRPKSHVAEDLPALLGNQVGAAFSLDDLLPSSFKVLGTEAVEGSVG